MPKKVVVRLSAEERVVCQEIIKPRQGAAPKVRRAQMWLTADADGPGWSDVKIAEAFNCRVQTIEHLRTRLVMEGFARVWDGKKRPEPPTPCTLDGEAAATRLALRLGKPPARHGPWTLPRLADARVAWEIVEASRDETVRPVLKKLV